MTREKIEQAAKMYAQHFGDGTNDNPVRILDWAIRALARNALGGMTKFVVLAILIPFVDWNSMEFQGPLLPRRLGVHPGEAWRTSSCEDQGSLQGTMMFVLKQSFCITFQQP